MARSLHEWEQQHGSVIKGGLLQLFKLKPRDDTRDNPLVKRARSEKWSVWSLEGGIERLVDALRDDVISKGVNIKLNSPVKDLSLNTDGRISIKSGDATITPDYVISCLPSYQLARVTEKLNSDLQTLLKSIPFADVAVVHLEYKGDNLLSQPSFGYLNPSTEPSKVIGVIFDTCCFPQENRTLMTVMMGGYWFQSLFGPNPSDEELLDVAISECSLLA